MEEEEEGSDSDHDSESDEASDSENESQEGTNESESGDEVDQMDKTKGEEAGMEVLPDPREPTFDAITAKEAESVNELQINCLEMLYFGSDDT